MYYTENRINKNLFSSKPTWYQSIGSLSKKSLDEVRGQILGRKRFPSLQEFFSKVRREKARRFVTMNLESPRTKTKFDSFAFVTKGFDQGEKGILKRVINHGRTTITNPSILVTPSRRFTENHQTKGRNMARRVVPTKLKAMNKGNNRP